jgi:hypothetical protein
MIHYRGQSLSLSMSYVSYDRLLVLALVLFLNAVFTIIWLKQ